MSTVQLFTKYGGKVYSAALDDGDDATPQQTTVAIDFDYPGLRFEESVFQKVYPLLAEQWIEEGRTITRLKEEQ